MIRDLIGPLCEAEAVVSGSPLPQIQLLSKDFGKHLLEVDDLLQKHSLQETDISVQAERVQTLNTAALKFTAIEGERESVVLAGQTGSSDCPPSPPKNHMKSGVSKVIFRMFFFCFCFCFLK